MDLAVSVSEILVDLPEAFMIYSFSLLCGSSLLHNLNSHCPAPALSDFLSESRVSLLLFFFFF